MNLPIPGQKLLYKTVNEVQLYMHVFYPPGHCVTDCRASIVFFFGGGWLRGTPTQFFYHCQHLASMGMVAISAEYRTSSTHGTTPFTCVADGKSALRWVRQHAAELGIDPARIAAGGGSAGGHVAAATAMLREFDDPADDSTISSRPNALILFNPVIDNSQAGYGYERVSERWEAFSPLHNISPGAPPTVFFLGSEDHLIPVATADKFKQRMEAAGTRCDVHIYQGQSHGFFNYRDGSNPYYSITLAEAEAFLASLGYFPVK